MKRVYLDKEKKGSVVCEKCGRVAKLDRPEIKKNQTTLVKCKCGHSFSLLVDQRQHYRKKVFLPGSFEITNLEKTIKKKITIHDISQTGIGFVTYKKNELNRDDVVRIRFVLDDPHSSRIDVQGIVRIVEDQYVGVQLDRPNEHTQKILGFYLMQDVGRRKRDEAASRVSADHHSGEQEDNWNPFHVPMDKEKRPVGFRGDLKALPGKSLLRILSSEKKTGVLHLARGRRRVAVCLKQGDIVAVSGNEWKPLGQRLLEQGAITKKILDQALKLAKQTGRRLGEILLESRAIGEATLKEVMRLRIDESERELSDWADGSFDYQDCAVDFDDRVAVPKVASEDQRNKLFGKRKREYSRRDVAWVGQIITNDGPIPAEIRNVSLTGALIYCRQLPDPKHSHSLSIEIKSHQYHMAVTVEMIRLDVVYVDYQGPIYGIGMRFVEINENDLEFLSTTILG